MSDVEENVNGKVNIKRAIESFVLDPSLKDDVYCLETLKEAYEASQLGNFGVGAVLVDEITGKIVLRARNSVFDPYFKSDMHAEMKILSEYEDKMRGRSGEIYSHLVLYISLEPCPMCYVRILNCGIQKVFFAANDPIGGMVSRKELIPQMWQRLSNEKIIKKASCSKRLSELSWEVFNLNLTNLTRVLEGNTK